MGISANSVLLRKMMKSFIILNILVSVVVVNVGGQSSSPSWTDGECCPTKMVGGKKYRLVGQSDEAWDFGCSSDCTYKTRDSDVKYCFKPGSLNSECFWEEGEGGSRPPMTGSPGSRPPTTPGNRPPTTPGNRPPTTEGNRPPTTEGNRPTTAGGNTGGCPQVRPDFNTDCRDGQEGLDCDYGEQECCGSKWPEIKMECRGNHWQGYYVDTICMIGGGSCPPNTTQPAVTCVCPAVFSPVCGTNNQTFSNSCGAQCEGREIGCHGDCPCPDCICIEIYQPVCGTDGKTYSNSCKAEQCARAEVQCEGECPCAS